MTQRQKQLTKKQKMKQILDRLRQRDEESRPANEGATSQPAEAKGD